MKRIGPYSRPGRLAVIDGRRAEAKRLKEIRDDLTAHLGGKPSTTQRLIAERVAVLLLRVELMDRKSLRDGALSEKDTREYLCWVNSASRLLRQLGLKAAPPPVRTLDDIRADRATRQATAA